jgi:hypothetical protein
VSPSSGTRLDLKNEVVRSDSALSSGSESEACIVTTRSLIMAWSSTGRLVALAAAMLLLGVTQAMLTPDERQVAEEIALSAYEGRLKLESGRRLLSEEQWTDDTQEEEMLDSSAPKTTQGKGFKIPFYPGNSTVFSPQKSKSFRVVGTKSFAGGT